MALDQFHTLRGVIMHGPGMFAHVASPPVLALLALLHCPARAAAALDVWQGRMRYPCTAEC
jgi:hypothetical protein